MSLQIRPTEFDIVVSAGPRVNLFPSVGARAISTICSQAGLKVGLFGGQGIRTRGTIPLPGIGGIVVLEDFQGRIHRVRAKSVVRISAESEMPDPFPGWRTPNLIPLKTAKKLFDSESLVWNPGVALLGTGNAALMFASRLLEKEKAKDVFCIETSSNWEGKRYAGWEVLRRRFEMAGGKILEGKVLSLEQKEAGISTLKIEDSYGVRLTDVSFVIGAGPYRDLPGLKEYPPGSLLFELRNTSERLPEDDINGWNLEEQRGKWLASKIVRVLGTKGKYPFDPKKLFRVSRQNVRNSKSHRREPFTPVYEGKWLSSKDREFLKSFEGVPQRLHQKKKIASAECFEDIACRRCESVCPENAIKIDRTKTEQGSFLIEDRCTACGICLTECPGNVVSMIHEDAKSSFSSLTLSWRGEEEWEKGQQVSILNRQGDHLGTGKVQSLEKKESDTLVEVQVPTHLIWEARGIRKLREDKVVDDQVVRDLRRKPRTPWVDINLDGYARRAREEALVSTALYEMGRARCEDVLICEDGSCGLCALEVDGVDKLACQTRIRKGMSIKLKKEEELCDSTSICTCQSISSGEVLDRLEQGHLSSAEAVLSVIPLAKGKCHGILCREAVRRLLIDNGIDASRWIDWRFPITDWRIPPYSP